MRQRAVIIASVCAMMLLATPAFPQAEGPIGTSIIRLIVSPDRYQGKSVQVTGFLRLEFEGNAIYLSKNDYDQRISKDGLWIETNDLLESQESKINNHYVLLEGRFDARITGHFGLWSGAITDVRRVVLIDAQR